MDILLHADDAGIGESATHMIADAWQQNMIHGFGIIANKACSKMIGHALENHQQIACTLSAHLNLTDGLSFRTNTHSSIIADANGHLNVQFSKALFLLIRGGEKRKQFLQQVKEEWDAQLSFIQQNSGGRKITAINGHNHIHMLPAVFEIAVELAKKYQIPNVRFVNEAFFLASRRDLFKPLFYVNMIKLILLTFCKWKIRKKKIQFAALSQETFGVLYSNHISTAVLRKAIAAAKKRNVLSLEVIVHPGQSTAAEMEQWASFKGGKLFFIDEKRKTEWEALKQFQHESGSSYSYHGS